MSGISLIVTADNPRTIMDALTTPAAARAMVREGETVWRAAVARADECAGARPEQWMVTAYPAAWTPEARMERWRSCLHRVRCAREGLQRDRARLARVLALGSEVAGVEQTWGVAAE